MLFAVAELLVFYWWPTDNNKRDRDHKVTLRNPLTFVSFYSASALLAMQSAVLARKIPSVRLSVCPSVRHVPVLYPDE